MQILFLTQVLPFPLDAGPKTRAYYVLRYLAAQGHEVTLVSFVRSSDLASSIDHLSQFCAEVHTVPMVRSRAKDLWYLGKSIVQQFPFLIARDHVAAMQEQIGSLVQRQQFDAIHADQLWMAQYALGATAHLNGRAATTQLVVDQHNAVHLIPQRLAEMEPNPFKRRILQREAGSMKLYELDTCAQFDSVVWVTDEDRRVIEDASTRPMDSITIPICVDPEVKTEIDMKPGARRVTFLGGLHWPPNAEGVVWLAQEVWPRVLQQVPAARLTVIGKDPPRALLNANKNIPNLDVTGYVDDPRPLLGETAVFIVPLHAGGGMRVKIIDAWSWGLPIVSTTVGAEGIKYQDGDDLLIADKEDAFADAVVRVLTQPELAGHLRRNGRLKVESAYDWHKTYRDWDQVYPIPK